jgi:transcriptional regulator with XRE-family HTH domain
MDKNDIEQRIGLWILNTRKYKGLDIRELSKQSGVAIGMISRIENGLSIATFSTIVRLCFGLGVKAESFSEQIGIASIQHKYQINPDRSSYTLPVYLTILDLEAFKLVYRFDEAAARDDLISLWKTLLEMIELVERKAETRDKTERDFLDMVFDKYAVTDVMNPSQQAINRFQEDQKKIARIRVGNGDALQISTAQINNATATKKRTPLEYPLMGNFELSDILRSGGVISLLDAGQYLKNFRQQKQKTLINLQDSLDISRNVLSRIEYGDMERVRVSEIAMVDQLLEAEGRILTMFWAAFEYNTGIEAARLTQNRETEIKTTQKAAVSSYLDPFQDTLIRIARWYQCYPINQNDRIWIDQERKKWEMYSLPTGLYGQISPYDYILVFNKTWEVFSPYLIRLCYTPRYPGDGDTDSIPPEIMELWKIFDKYLAIDLVFSALKKDLVDHREDLDFFGGVRSQMKKAWWNNETLRTEVESYLQHYHPKFMEEMGL